jgi:hypothetical protein
MIITDCRKVRNNDRSRICATIIWEDTHREKFELYVETDMDFEDTIAVNPNVFILGCIVPALYYGEERIKVDAEISPMLYGGINSSLRLLHRWFYAKDHKIPVLECKIRNILSAHRYKNRAGFFFSGGIDSYATLRLNQLTYPREHPWRLKDALLVFGLEQDDLQKFLFVKKMIDTVSGRLNLRVIPIYTNVYLPYREEDALGGFKFWEYHFEGAAFSSIAHAFSESLDCVSISSTLDPDYQVPYGSHPYIDPYFSSEELLIQHTGFSLSRFEKTKLLKDWELPLNYLRVCNSFKKYSDGVLNCGKCEKCARTILALYCLDILEKCNAFPKFDITHEYLNKTLKIKSDYMIGYYLDLIEPLAIKGRDDLIKVINKKIQDYKYPPSQLGIKIKRLNPRYFKKYLHRIFAHSHA